MSRIMGEHFHPTEVELMKFLTRFLKGESFPIQCPIKLAEIYGNQPPWKIFENLNSEEKVGYFISPLKKRKESDERYCRNCGNGTWRGQTSGKPIKNRKGSVIGFRRNYIYQIPGSTKKQEKTTANWLMKEYFVGDDFFIKNNIPKQHFALCRIKKNIKVKDVGVIMTCNMDEKVVDGVIKSMLQRSDTEHDRVMEENDDWDLIIEKVCDEQANEVENTANRVFEGIVVDGIIQSTLQGPDAEHDGVMEESDDWDLIIDKVCDEQADEVENTATGECELWQGMNRIFEEIVVHIPDVWLDPSPLLL